MAGTGIRARRSGAATAWILVVLALAIGPFSYRYLIPGAPLGSAPILANFFARYGVLTVHAGFAATALILGPLQFFGAIRTRHPRWHRRIGTAYVICCLGAGAAGLLLALGSTAGPVASAGFGLLALAWFGATANAWRLARARDFVRHRRWMIRSYALTFAAVTLRLYLPIVLIAHLDYDWSYRAIAFLCWVPNLIVVELMLRRPPLPLARAASNPL
jgi:hypothetical protein